MSQPPAPLSQRAEPLRVGWCTSDNGHSVNLRAGADRALVAWRSLSLAAPTYAVSRGGNLAGQRLVGAGCHAPGARPDPRRVAASLVVVVLAPAVAALWSPWSWVRWKEGARCRARVTPSQQPSPHIRGHSFWVLVFYCGSRNERRGTIIRTIWTRFSTRACSAASVRSASKSLTHWRQMARTSGVTFRQWGGQNRKRAPSRRLQPRTEHSCVFATCVPAPRPATAYRSTPPVARKGGAKAPAGASSLGLGRSTPNRPGRLPSS